MKSWSEFPCIYMVLDFFWAKDASCLRRMGLAVGVLKVISTHWCAAAKKSLEAWSRTHSPLSVALHAMAFPLYVPWMSHDALVIWTPWNLPIHNKRFKCCLKCCRKQVGQLVPVCPRTGGTWASVHFPNAFPNIYGDSDYVYPARTDGNARHDLSYHRSTIFQAMRSMHRSDLYAWDRKDLTGYIVPGMSRDAWQYDTWRVKGISVACSKECYKILKLMTRDPSTDGFRARHGLQRVSREFWRDGFYLCLRGVDACDFTGGYDSSRGSVI